MDSVPSTAAYGNLDEQIAQLMQCKPLSELEVPAFLFSFKFQFSWKILVFKVPFFKFSLQFIRFYDSFMAFLVSRWFDLKFESNGTRYCFLS